MLKLLVATVCMGAAAATASDPGLICFGNEPSWGVNLTAPGTAVFSTPDEAPVAFRGSATRNEVLAESVWRGSSDADGELVLFLRDAACSDGMSDTVHPLVARGSLPDGRFIVGCCRIPAPPGDPTAPGGLEH